MHTLSSRIQFLIALVVILSLLLAACAPAPAPAQPAPAAEPTKVAAAEPTKAPAVAPTKAAAPAASADEERRKTVIFDIDGGRINAPDQWNPYVPGSRKDHGYHQAMIEPLFMSNLLTGEMEPWLAESMEPNQTLDVWTLKLRDGVKWSDGKPFTADDVVFTIDLLLKNAPNLNDSGSMKEWVKQVEKVDDRTVKFTLNKPNPRFKMDYFAVKIWGSIVILPKHIWEGQDPLTFKNYDPAKGWPVFTGPYKLVSANQNEVSYKRDDNWWGAKSGWKPLPKPEKLIWTWAGPEESRVALMADGKLDSLMDITLGAFQALQKRNPKVIAWTKELPYAHIEPTCTRTLELNTTKAPWDDPEMRWALNYAINRDQVVKVAYEGTTVPSRHYFPISQPLNRLVDLAEKAGQYQKYPLTKYDPEKAKQIIESKGWKKGSDGYYAKDGKQLALTIEAHEAFIEMQRLPQVIVEQLQSLGINATMRVLAGPAWGDSKSFGRFEASAGWQTCGSVSEPWASMNTFNSRWVVPVEERASNNPWRWKNDEYSKLIDEMGTLPLGDPKIDDLFLKANEIWMKDLPVIPVTQARKLTPFDTTYWTGWPTSDNRYASPTTWWQNGHAVIHRLQPAAK